MKSKQKKTAVLLISLLLSVTAVAGLQAQVEEYKTILGTWDGEMDGGKFFDLIFTVKRDSLAGKMVFDKDVEIELSAIKLTGNKLTCTANFPGKGSGYGMDVEMEFTDGTFSGVLTSEKGDTYLSGQKRK